MVDWLIFTRFREPKLATAGEGPTEGRGRGLIG